MNIENNGNGYDSRKELSIATESAVQVESLTNRHGDRFELDTDPDAEARARNLYGIEIRRCFPNRRIEITSPHGPKVVVDFATNSPFALNVRKEIMRASIEAVKRYGGLHSSIAAARAQTGLSEEICSRLVQMKGANSVARLYPTTFAANIAVAGGLAALNPSVIVHPNAHATVQFALKGALAPSQIIRSGNTCEVAAAYAKTTGASGYLVGEGSRSNPPQWK